MVLNGLARSINHKLKGIAHFAVLSTAAPSNNFISSTTNYWGHTDFL